jgi:glycosyltransferase involved in cell wall biosynthesis
VNPLTSPTWRSGRADGKCKQPIVLFVDNDARTFLSHRLPLARAAARAGFDVHVAVPAGNKIQDLRTAGFRVHLLRLDRLGTRPLSELLSVIELAHLYNRLRPALVHHLRIKPVVYGGIVARLMRIPHVVNALTGLGYVFSSNTVKARMLRPLVRLGLRLALRYREQVTILQNSDDLDALLAARLATRDKVTLIRGSGVDVDEFLPLEEPAGDPVVVLPSRLIWEKGIAEFVVAAQIVRKTCPNARFALVGGPDPGNQRSVPISQLQSWQSAGLVEWWGWRNDIQTVFAETHIVCLPSYGEGVPKVLIEAAACGRPVVGADAPGCREIVRHRRNGLLVPTRDPVALAAALEELIGSPALRASLGAAGRAMVISEFSLSRVIADTLALYGKFLTTPV